MPFPWTCPFCNRDTTITESNYYLSSTNFTIENSEGPRILQYFFIVCPNKVCRKFTLEISLYKLERDPGNRPAIGALIQSWPLIPQSKAKSFPDCIPKVILDDYNEACLICNLSPKASATLSRRCLQGIIRDFWQVKPGRLVDEIDQIKDRVDPDTWGAIESVRKVGNIGAHMEKDINLILDVEPKEAALLIGLIETLLKDWYIIREARKSRLQAIKNIAEKKEQMKTDGEENP